MAKLSKLSVAELAAMKQRKPRLDLSEYINLLSGLKVGEGGRVELDKKEDPRKLKRHINLAAKEKNMKLRWRPQQDHTMVFEVKQA